MLLKNFKKLLGPFAVGLLIVVLVFSFSAKSAEAGFFGNFFNRISNVMNSAAVFLAGGTPTTNYQGKLTNTSGVSVSDGNYNIRFNLYTVASGGSPIWSEEYTGGNKISVSKGLFSTLLGSVNPLNGIDFNQPLYLGVEVGGTGGSPSWDGEMTPRKVLGAVPAWFQEKVWGQYLQHLWQVL